MSSLSSQQPELPVPVGLGLLRRSFQYDNNNNNNNNIRHREESEYDDDHYDNDGQQHNNNSSSNNSNNNNQFVTDNGQVIEEMTEEQEQEIYEIPNIHASPSTSPPHRRTFLQQISQISTSMAKISSSNHHNHTQSNNNNNHNNNINNHHQHYNHNQSAGALLSAPHNQGSNSSSSSSSGRLRSSYDLLETEYCKLKFEQTELVALADQRKMEKQRSAELMESLEEDLNRQRNENARLVVHKNQLLLVLEEEEEEETLLQSKNSQDSTTPPNPQRKELWSKRDSARNELEETVDELDNLRLENKKLLELLQVPPTIPRDEIKRELLRIQKEQKVAQLEAHLQTLSKDVYRLRQPIPNKVLLVPQHSKSATTASRTSTGSSAGGARLSTIMIGTEIVVDESTAGMLRQELDA